MQPATVQRLKAHFAARKMDWEQLKRFKPELLMSVITVAELQSIGLNQAGVDEFFFKRAGRDKKERSWLESVDEQIVLLQKMAAGDPNDLINYTLNDLKNLSQSIDQLRTAWRSGDLTHMEKVVIAEMSETYPGIYQTLLVARNQRWLPQIQQMLTTPEIELVLVGGLHLAGKDSVLALLRAQGYKVKPL